MGVHVAIVGLGLIGSSLSRALKNANKDYTITGIDVSSEVVKLARTLEVADFYDTDPAIGVKDADVVVIATPLKTYPTVLEATAPALKKDAIITDVGSVKGNVIESILPFLSNAQHPFFVPGHPIAGTEKSGPEAGFGELFQEKSVVLTPMSFTNKGAIETIKNMWKDAGAKHVNTMDAAEHDKIYALVSHDIQLLISAYMLTFDSLPPGTQGEISTNLTAQWRRFIRIGASDPTMWRDVFLTNSKNILDTMGDLTDHLASLAEELDDENIDSLQARIREARSHRSHFDIAPDDPEVLKRAGAEGLNDYAHMFRDVLPVLITCSTIEMVPESYYDYARGAGFQGVTRPVLTEASDDIALMLEKKKAIVTATRSFLSQVNLLLSLITRGDGKALFIALEKARRIYHEFS
jgi:cyclohexadieny/prephenate dehydrogenase